MKKLKILLGLGAVTTLSGGVAVAATACNSEVYDIQIDTSNISTVLSPTNEASNYKISATLDGQKVDLSTATVNVTSANEDVIKAKWSANKVKLTPISTGVTSIKIEVTANGKKGLANLNMCVTNAAVQSLTYLELWELRQEGKLIPGQQYRITDYTCTLATTTITGQGEVCPIWDDFSGGGATTTGYGYAQTANHHFDIIVTATSNTSLSENAKAVKNAEDTYFNNCYLDTWEIKYSLDNPTIDYYHGIKRFQWAPLAEPTDNAPTGKGVIYYMRDEWNNEAGYDFKNILFRRWKVTAVTNNDLQGYADWIKTNYYASWTTMRDLTVDATDYRWAYTFNDWDSNGDPEDLSLNFGIDPQEESNRITNNVFEETIGFYGDRVLTNTVMLGYANKFNRFGASCSANTFLSTTCANTFDYATRFNIFGGNCHYNTFANKCDYNYIGHNLQNSVFGNSFSNNTINHNTNTLKFGNACSNNVLGQNTMANSFGDSCTNNTIFTGCQGNVFGNYCTNNSLYTSCYSCTFGNECSYNVLGQQSEGNTFGNLCRGNFIEWGGYNNFGNYCMFNEMTTCMGNVFGDFCVGNRLGYYKNGDIWIPSPLKSTFIIYNIFGANCQNNQVNFDNATTGKWFVMNEINATVGKTDFGGNVQNIFNQGIKSNNLIFKINDGSGETEFDGNTIEFNTSAGAKTLTINTYVNGTKAGDNDITWTITSQGVPSGFHFGNGTASNKNVLTIDQNTAYRENWISFTGTNASGNTFFMYLKILAYVS